VLLPPCPSVFSGNTWLDVISPACCSPDAEEDEDVPRIATNAMHRGNVFGSLGGGDKKQNFGSSPEIGALPTIFSETFIVPLVSIYGSPLYFARHV